ncbi:MAG: bifunctional DNA-formamidopyrimidine glycosylase/DNA-(apurinic or apyrimidinic site) lyase [Gemmatimonadetes bacterium]|nr:bifunctional DNA-formamidopyrimidine glycosylase/DNA-(apurinic or apyrimidinic site) lyase [Gemmatimonadota bacterium]
MPELPEVETVVRQLAEAVPGLVISDVRVLQPDLISSTPAFFRSETVGSAIECVGRRGKNIVLTLSRSRILVVNLGMTGQLLYLSSGFDESPEETPNLPSHPGVFFRFRPAGALVYADIRRFGSLRLFSPEEWRKESARLGPEPLCPSLDGKAFRDSLKKSRSPIRSWLLDQTKIAGVGNIYASEALFRAKIHPRTPARSLGRRESDRLLEAIRAVLSEAIEARGTTLRDYRTASGGRGGFGPSLRVYGREGDPCPGCNTPIGRVVFANRSAFFCPSCQKGS